MALGAPGEFGGAGEVVDVAGEDEEVVAEAVDVGEDYGVDVGSGVGEGEDVAFGASADCAGDVGVGGSDRTAGEYELAELRDHRVEEVDLVFEVAERGGGDGGFRGGGLVVGGVVIVGVLVAGGGGEVGSDVEEGVVDCQEG